MVVGGMAAMEDTEEYHMEGEAVAAVGGTRGMIVEYG